MRLDIVSTVFRLGYSAVVYIRAEVSDSIGAIKLLMAKSRVAPLKTKFTIPNLELRVQYK